MPTTSPANIQHPARAPSLLLIRIPHWGWRGESGGLIYEIERITVGLGERSTRFRACVRRRGCNVPLTGRTFGTLASARSWLVQQQDILGVMPTPHPRLALRTPTPHQRSTPRKPTTMRRV